MDAYSKLKLINERANSSFTNKFYKLSDVSNPNESSNSAIKESDKRFREVEWFKPLSLG